MSAATEQVDESQARNPIVYARLGVHAAFQVETIALALRDFAIADARKEELDLFAITTSCRLRELSGALMAITSGQGEPHLAETVWGGSFYAFAATLPPEDFEDGDGDGP